MALLSFLKSSDKAMDALIKGGDALVFTAEERAKFEQKKGELWLDLQKTIAEQSTPTSISRRYVAMTVLIPFVFLILGSAAFDALAVFLEFTPEKAKAVGEMSDHWADLAEENFGFAVGSVVIFYYGPHLLSKFNQVKK